MKKADLILTADWHLRDTPPKKRTDDYWRTQCKKVKFIHDLADEHGCPVIVAGDLLDKWKSTPYLMRWCIENLPRPLICVPGQHELPNHSHELIDKGGLGVLRSAGVITVLGDGQPTYTCIDRENPLLNRPIFDSLTDTVVNAQVENKHGDGRLRRPVNELQPLKKQRSKPLKKQGVKNTPVDRLICVVGAGWRTPITKLTIDCYRSVGVYHGLVACGKESWYRHVESEDGHKVLKEFDTDLVVTGDNHITHVIDGKKRKLVNPGSLMRMATDQVKHKPVVWLWYADNNSIAPVYLPVDNNVFADDNAEGELHGERFDEFVRHVQDMDVGLSFEANMKRYAKENNVSAKIMDIIHSAMEV